MDEFVSYIQYNKKMYNESLAGFINEINNDEEEIKYANWHYKHFHSNWLFKLWKNLNKYDTQSIHIIREEGHLDYIIKPTNWTLISRLVDLTDKKFMRIFGDLIDMDFASKYNPTYEYL